MGELNGRMKPMKPMSFSEVRRSGDSVPCWVEEKYVIYPDVLCKNNDTYYGRIQLLEGVLPRSCYLLEADQYGKTWRCWAMRPTIEERETAAWES